MFSKNNLRMGGGSVRTKEFRIIWQNLSITTLKQEKNINQM